MSRICENQQNLENNVMYVLIEVENQFTMSNNRNNQEDAATAPGVFRPCLSVNTLGLPKISESP